MRYVIMENTKKMTKKDYFAQLVGIVEGAEVDNKTELLDFITHEVELLNKKNSRSGKPTARQVENEKIKTSIMTILECGKPLTVTQIMTALNDSSLSNQRVSALLTQLKDNKEVVRTVEKKVAFYSINTKVEEIDEEEGEGEE
jgi:hypothetical protein